MVFMQYENQACIFGKWGTIGLLRPSFSDARGKRKLKKDYFVEPEGWRWEDDWFINPELRYIYYFHIHLHDACVRACVRE